MLLNSTLLDCDMEDVPDALVHAILEASELNPYWRLLGIRIDEVRRGYCRGHVVINDSHKQLAGLVHGGIHVSIADSLTWVAVFTYYAPRAVSAVTVELKVNYLSVPKASPGGDMGILLGSWTIGDWP
jgi:acyl-coenzyme A thioesterase PaaI-like protein